MEELAARRVDTLIRMRAEEIALRLDQICRQPLRSVRIVIRQRRIEDRCGYSLRRRSGDCGPPVSLAPFDFTPEIRVEKQVRQPGFPLIRIGNFLQEARPDNASTAPYFC